MLRAALGLRAQKCAVTVYCRFLPMILCGETIVRFITLLLVFDYKAKLMHVSLQK